MKAWKELPLAISKTLYSQLQNGYVESPFQKEDREGIVYIMGMIDDKNLQNIRIDFDKNLKNPKVDKIILKVNSGGGVVSGVDELAQYIYESRSIKPIIAHVQEACSAAYWLACAADKILLEGRTSIVGSIGVLCVHDDISEALKKDGITRTELYAGTLKTVGSSSKPLDSTGRSEIQSKVDYFYKIFLDAVSRNRKIGVDKIEKDAKVYLASDAIRVGLADGFINMEIEGAYGMDEIEELKKKIEELQKENEELKKKLEPKQEEAKAEEPKQEEPKKEEEPKAEQEEEKKPVEEVVKKAIAAERQRINALDSICLPGYEKVIEEAKNSGSSYEVISFKILQDYKKNKMSALRSESKYVASSFNVVESEAQKINQMAERIAKGGK